jgi:hypothetical protein
MVYGGDITYTLHSTPYTLHSTLYTLHSTLYTLHPTLYTLHSTPYTLHSTLYTRHPTPYTLHPTPYTPSLILKPSTYLSESTQGAEPQTLKTKRSTCQNTPRAGRSGGRSSPRTRRGLYFLESIFKNTWSCLAATPSWSGKHGRLGTLSCRGLGIMPSRAR